MKLSGNIVLKVLAIQVVLLQYMATAIWMKDLFQTTYKTLNVLLVVDTVAVQDRLDEYFQENPDAPRLFIPETPPAGLNAGKHLVFITFGFVSGAETGNLASDESIMLVMIPHLASSPRGSAHYSLMIGEFVPDSMPGFTQFDEITLTDDVIRVRTHLGEMFKAKYKVPNPCVPSASLVRHEVDDEVIQGFLFNDVAILNRGECDGERAAELPEHCAKMKSVMEGIHLYEPNVCGVNSVTDETTCDAEFEITTITEGFRDMLLLAGDGPITVEGVEEFQALVSSGFKYPCIE